MRKMFYDGDTVVVTDKCPFCGKYSTVVCDRTEFNNWLDGMSIQKAMPTTPPQSREFLLSGMCRDCQEDFFE